MGGVDSEIHKHEASQWDAEAKVRKGQEETVSEGHQEACLIDRLSDNQCSGTHRMSVAVRDAEKAERSACTSCGRACL